MKEHSRNKNVEALANGFEFRLEITTANFQNSHEFARTKSDAKTRKKELKEAGYNATAFKITKDGGLLLF